MKTWKLLVVACMTAFLFGCGGGGGGDNSGTDEPPTISNAFISPAVATYYQGGGTINVNLTMKFTDSGGNVKSFTLNIYDVNNSQLSTNTYPISGISGVTNGTISGVVTIPTTTIGNYTWKIFVTDAASHKSNILNGSFDIITSQMTQSSATALITSYLSTLYQSDVAAVNNDIASIEAQATVAGDYGSTNMANSLLTNKQSHVQRFLDSAFAYIQTISKNTYGTIDKPTIINLLAGYQTRDLAWPSSFTVANVSPGWLQNLSTTTSPPYSTDINNAYNYVVTMINAL